MRHSITRLVLALAILPAEGVQAQGTACPAAKLLPQLTIDKIHKPVLPVIDDWQVFWGDVPLSDVQLAMLAGNDPLLESATQEIEDRGTWVYIGMLITAAGTGLTSVGWMLFGQGDQPKAITLPMALGGIVVGMAGVVTAAYFLQTPLEPLLAPTPVHRFSRSQIRRMVYVVNQQLQRDICTAVQVSPSMPLLQLKMPGSGQDRQP